MARLPEEFPLDSSLIERSLCYGVFKGSPEGQTEETFQVLDLQCSNMYQVETLRNVEPST